MTDQPTPANTPRSPMATGAQCVIEGCQKPRRQRGWCHMHYERWRVHGDPNGGGRRYLDPEERFSVHLREVGGCVVWTGMLCKGGYGRMTLNRRIIQAHRYAWERSNGAIPPGMFIDHICHNRACVKVAHLRLATRQQNNSNLSGPRSGRKYKLPRGVTWRNGEYQASVQFNKIRHHLGTFTSVEAAAEAACTARAQLFGEFAGN